MGRFHWLASRRLSILALIVVAVLPLAACGDDESASFETTTQTGGRTAPEPTPDPKNLVVQLADLPAQFRPVPGERIPTSLATVLADPWSAGYEAVIRRERVAGYQTSFWNPELQRIECATAVYRSSKGAREVFRLRMERFRGFLVASEGGRPIHVERIGAETTSYRLELGRTRGFLVAWRYRNVLASCTTTGRGPADLRQIVGVSLAQQHRISEALG